MRATHCFTDYVEKAKFKVAFRRPSRANGANTSTNTLESLLLADHGLFEESDELREWRGKLDELEPHSDESLTHLRWLFRLGLSISEGNPRFYSFCLKKWTDEDEHRHCAVCKRYCSIKTSWRCSVCRQCRHDGLEVTCSRCGGRSSTAISRQEKEYEIWRNLGSRNSFRSWGETDCDPLMTIRSRQV